MRSRSTAAEGTPSAHRFAPPTRASGEIPRSDAPMLIASPSTIQEVGNPCAYSPPPEAPTRTPSAAAVAVAMGCFAVAFLLMGGACYLALGWDASPMVQRPAVAAGTLAAAVAFAGLGVLNLARFNAGKQTRHSKSSQAEARAKEPDLTQKRLDALDLTDKEREVALLILQHRSYCDIAELSGITPRTVQFHASNVFHKAQVTRRRDFERLMLEKIPSPAEPPPAGVAGASNCLTSAPFATPPCAFPECAACQREDRMACLRTEHPAFSEPRPPQVPSRISFPSPTKR